MSDDGSIFDGGDGDGGAGSVGIPRKVLLFGGGALLFVGVLTLMNRNKPLGAQPSGPDTGSIGLDASSVVVLPASALYGIQNALLNGPWHDSMIDANPNPTSPDGGADGINPPPPPPPPPLKPHPTYIDHIAGGNLTLPQIAMRYHQPGADKLYYLTANLPVRSYIQTKNPHGGPSKYSTVAIPNNLTVYFVTPYLIAG